MTTDILSIVPYNTRLLLTLGGILLLGVFSFALPACQSAPTLAPADRLASYSDEPWRAVLSASVRNGLVDYAAIDDRLSLELDRYLFAVANFGPTTTPEAFPTRDHQLAYYLNAYNAFMIRKWLDSGARTAKPGKGVNWLVWFTTDQWAIDGGYMSMDALEQRLIRPRFNEPRIHFALICGAESCPPLLNEAYTAARLTAQMDAVAAQWFQEPDALVVNADGSIELSSILKWYRSDFDALGGLRGTLDKYLPKSDPRKATVMQAFDAGRVSFLPYDWSINKAF